MKTRVAAIWGGFSSEKEVSEKSVKTIITHLDPEKYDVKKVRIDNEGWFCETDNGEVVIDKNDFTYGDGERFDYAFIMIHGSPGEDGKLQAYFDMIGLPYSTCNQLMSTITFDKWSCNHILRSLGMKCARSVLVREGEKANTEQIAAELGYPMFVKPNDSGSSFGITKVKEISEIEGAIQKAWDEGTDALIEEFLDGTEVTCGAYHDGNDMIVLPITEIVSKNEFFDFGAKYYGESDEITPARISHEMTSTIQQIVYDLSIKLGLKGIIRMDFIIQNDEPYMIEINTVPGFSEASIVPQQIEAAGMTVSDVVNAVVEAGIKV